jgi:hypothetical protein
MQRSPMPHSPIRADTNVSRPLLLRGMGGGMMHSPHPLSTGASSRTGPRLRYSGLPRYWVTCGSAVPREEQACGKKGVKHLHWTAPYCAEQLAQGLGHLQQWEEGQSRERPTLAERRARVCIRRARRNGRAALPGPRVLGRQLPAAPHAPPHKCPEGAAVAASRWEWVSQGRTQLL